MTKSRRKNEQTKSNPTLTDPLRGTEAHGENPEKER